VLQEWPDDVIEQALEDNLSEISSERFSIVKGEWGHSELNFQLISTRSIDYIICADCFYSKKSFPFLLNTIKETLIHLQSRAICIYHHRK